MPLHGTWSEGAEGARKPHKQQDGPELAASFIARTRTFCWRAWGHLGAPSKRRLTLDLVMTPGFWD